MLVLSLHALRQAQRRKITCEEIEQALAAPETTYPSAEYPTERIVVLGRTVAGVWVGAVDLGRDVDGRRRRAKVHGRTRAEVRAKLAELRRQHDEGLPVPDRRLTVAALADLWLARGLPAELSTPTRDNSPQGDRARRRPQLRRDRR